MIINKEFDTMFSPSSFNFKANMAAKTTIQPIFINNESLYDSNYRNIIMVEHDCNISQELINQAVEDYFVHNDVPGGVSDYSDLKSKPKINGVELSGNKTAKDLNLQPAGDYLSSIPKEYVTHEDLDGYVQKDEIKDIEIELPDWIGDEKPVYTAEEVEADKVGTAENKVSEHNSSSTAHSDIRALISDIKIPEIPKNISGFVNDIGYITYIPNEYITEQELKNYNYAYKDDIPEVPVLSVNGQIGNVYLDADSIGALSNTIHIPTSTGELINNNGFITRTVNDLTNYYLKSEIYTQDEVKQLIGTIPKFSIQPVDILPVNNIDAFTVYLLKTGEDAENLYTEYIYVNNTWERLGVQTIDLAGYALVKDIPTTLSSLVNDMGFITNTVIDLVNYYKKNEVYNKEEIDGKGFLTQHQDLSTYAKKSDVPSVEGLASEEYVNEVIATISKVDLSPYAKTEDLPTKLGDLENDKGYLTSVPTEYITDTELNNKGYLTQHQSLVGYATETWVEEKNYLTQHQDLSDYAKKSELPTIPINVSAFINDSNYLTKNALLDFIYPVGSIYMSVNNVSPQTFLGGTWEQIQDRFLLAAGSIYAAGDTGGEAEHTLTVSEIPSHNHTVYARSVYSGTGSYIALCNKDNSSASYVTADKGGGKAHNNMPPYLAVYMWKRTA